MPARLGAFRLEANFAGRRLAAAERGIKALSRSVSIPLADVRPIVRRGMQDMLDTVAEAMRQRHSTPWGAESRLPAGRSGRLHIRSGRLLQQIADSVKVTENADGVSGEIGGPFWMAVHEGTRGKQNTTIRAKNRYVTYKGERVGPFLFIPLPSVLDSRGVPRRIPDRWWRSSFVIRSKKDKRAYLIVRREGDGIVPMFLLRRSVTLPARLGLRSTLDMASKVFAQRVIREIDEAFKRAVRVA